MESSGDELAKARQSIEALNAHLKAFDLWSQQQAYLDGVKEESAANAERFQQIGTVYSKAQIEEYKAGYTLAVSLLGDLFQPGGRYHGNLPLGVSLIEHGLPWLIKRLEKLEAERDEK